MIEVIRNVSSKILIFSSFTSCLDLVIRALKEYLPDRKYVIMDGSTSANERKKVLYEFKTDPNIQIFLTTYKTGSEGLNLTHANHIILMDAWWTFAVEDQAIARAYRMGQRHPVTVHRFFMRRGIESACVCVRASEKRKHAEDFLGGATKTINTKLSKFIMRNLLYHS